MLGQKGYVRNLDNKQSGSTNPSIYSTVKFFGSLAWIIFKTNVMEAAFFGGETTC